MVGKKITSKPLFLIRLGLGILFGWSLLMIIFNPAKYFGGMWDEIVLGGIIVSVLIIASAVVYGTRPKNLFARIGIGLVAAGLMTLVAYYSIYMFLVVRSFFGI